MVGAWQYQHHFLVRQGVIWDGAGLRPVEDMRPPPHPATLDRHHPPVHPQPKPQMFSGRRRRGTKIRTRRRGPGGEGRFRTVFVQGQPPSPFLFFLQASPPPDGGTRVGPEAPTGGTWAPRVRYEGVAHPRQPHRPLQEQVRAGCEDRAAGPPPRNITGEDDPCLFSRRAGPVQWSKRQLCARGVGRSISAGSNIWRCTPPLGSRRPRHAAALPRQASQFQPRSEVYTALVSCRACHPVSVPRGALDPWESSDSPCGDTPSQSRFSSVVKA